MKKLLLLITALLLCALLTGTLASCNTAPLPSAGSSSDPSPEPTKNDVLWAGATYQEDREFGSGSKTCTVKVTVGEHSVTFTLHTDREILSEALFDHELITAKPGNPGIYLQTANGVPAIWEEDGTYWAFYVNGAYAMAGVDATTITDGDAFELRRE